MWPELVLMQSGEQGCFLRLILYLDQLPSECRVLLLCHFEHAGESLQQGGFLAVRYH